MPKFIIEGGRPLTGEIEPVGNKNAVLKMIAATLLTSEPVTLTNVPAISDVRVMLRILEQMGTEVQYEQRGQTVTLTTKTLKTTVVPYEDAKKLRASNVLLGPILARAGKVTGVIPGGDKIGPREMNAHFDGLTQLGAVLGQTHGDVFTLKGTLRGATVFLYEPSVTATENVIMAAVLAKGKTTIENAASEPHVQELCRMLVSMGASIDGIGTNRLLITGVKKLHGTTHRVPPDFIYIGTMIVLTAITKGELLIKNVVHEDLRTILYFFSKLGVVTKKQGKHILVPKKQTLSMSDQVWGRIKGIYSQPWPCFPTDMMSLAIVLATQVKGSTLFFEKMYSGRMFFADYLNGMGAHITVADPYRVIVNGKTVLKGRTLQSPDLRAGMAYVAAGLCAKGITVVEGIEHIDRGYPNIEEVLRSLGAKIERAE